MLQARARKGVQFLVREINVGLTARAGDANAVESALNEELFLVWIKFYTIVVVFVGRRVSMIIVIETSPGIPCCINTIVVQCIIRNSSSCSPLLHDRIEKYAPLATHTHGREIVIVTVLQLAQPCSIRYPIPPQTRSPCP